MCIFHYYLSCYCGTESENMTEIEYNSDKWCCKETTEDCTMGSDLSVQCIGHAINLTQQCHSPKNNPIQCNYYPWDEYRWNDISYNGYIGTTRSFFDICEDNSSCVDEMKVCKGDPQCSNMNDLKWCKNATLWNKPTAWTPIHDHSMCNLTPQPAGMVSSGQVILTEQRDDLEYHCFNRADESPYSKNIYFYSDWLQWVNTPCDSDYYRRCIGRHPEKCVHTADWGHPEKMFGCQDKSDIHQNMTATDTSDFTCDDIYTGHPLHPVKVDWTWFKCLKTKKCIHIDSRCDLHPNIECIYEKNGIFVAEDEEECFDEYKRKGLIVNSANFVCQSPFHNTETPAVVSNVYYWDFYTTKFNVTVIPRGTKVEIQATRCNGIPECWINEDEEGCGLAQWEATLTVIASIVLLALVSLALSTFVEKIDKKYNSSNQLEDIFPMRNDSSDIKSLLKGENKSEIKRLIKSENSNLGTALRMINLKGYVEKDLMKRREMNKFFIQCLMEISPRAFIWLKQHVDYETCKIMISDWSYKATFFNRISDHFKSLMNDIAQRFTDNWIAKQFNKVLISKLQTLITIASVHLDLILDCILLSTIMVVIGHNIKYSSQFSTQIAIFLLVSILAPSLITASSIAFRRPFVVMNSQHWFKWRGSTIATVILRLAIIILFPFVPAMIMLSSKKAEEKSKAIADKYGDFDFLASDLEEIELLTKYINECRLAMLTYKRNEMSMELVIQLTIHMIMVLIGQTRYPLDSTLEAIFSDNKENKENSTSALFILVLSILWSFKTSALTAVKIKSGEKNVLLLYAKSVLALRYLLLFLVRIFSIVSYFSPFLGLGDIVAHYQAEIIPLDLDQFMSFNEKMYQYWNPIEEEFQSVNISQLFRFQNTPPSSKLYTLIGLGDAFFIFLAMLMTYSIVLGMLKYFINKDFRMASFAAKMQHIIEAINMPEMYSSDWDTDHELEEKEHLQNWWRVLREIIIMIAIQLISNLIMLVPFFVTASNVKARHELLEGAIGVFPEEKLAYREVKNLSWILPSVIIAGALLDMMLVFVYMRIAHPWKYISCDEELDKEVNEAGNNYGQDNETISRQYQGESAIEATINIMFENIQKEILERKSLREQAHKTILHLDKTTSRVSNVKSNTCHESESQAIVRKIIDDILENFIITDKKRSEK